MNGLIVAIALLWALVIVLAVMVFALARQIGILFERVAPMGALITDAGPKVGEAVRRFDLQALDGRAGRDRSPGRAIATGVFPLADLSGMQKAAAGPEIGFGCRRFLARYYPGQRR